MEMLGEVVRSREHAAEALGRCPGGGALVL